MWLLLKTPAVQNWLGHKVTDRISKTLGTKVTVKHIGFSLFNNMNVEGLYVEDLNKDTLLYAGNVQFKITDWFFLKDKAVISYVALKDVVATTYRKKETWNYQFIIDKLVDTSASTKSTKKAIELELQYVLLENIKVNQKDQWLGSNQFIQLSKLELKANQLNFNKKILDIASVQINDPYYENYSYTKLKPSINTPTIDTNKITEVSKHWQLFGWNILIDKLNIKNGTVKNDKQTERLPFTYFDGQHLQFSKIDADFEKIKWNTDTITLKANITTSERSGLTINKFKSNIRAYPNTIEFNNVDLQTPNTTINDNIAFSFNDFNEDISDFINKINIKATLKNTKISINDLALFAPNIKNTIKDDIFIDGKINGTVSNFRLYDGTIKAGKNTLLQGNLVMTGLPNINETYIDLTNGKLNTSYSDLINFVPSLAKVKGVSLNKLGQINYDGNFTGYINDFVTYGTLQTNLGTVITDLNMKLLPNTLPSYSGKIATDNFNLGSLINDKKLRNIGFNGIIKGKGFNLNEVDADIDGTTSKIEYGTYTYQNIVTKGKLKNKSFNGNININDNNLIADLKGIIDFSNASPKFDLTAQIEKSNFKKLQFTKEDYSLTGNVKLKFEGATISDFNGMISLDGATIKKDGEALPFDYITINSTKTKDGKYLTFTSNEFDGFVNGKFTYDNIVNAFGLFLHQYYPNVFNKPKKFDNNQHFDFELNTKNVEPYTKLISKDIIGFNNSFLKGSINTNTNEASFNATIPFLGFKQYTFDNLFLDGKGSTDSLVVKATIGTLNVNDSLSFTNTAFNIQTINNQSTFSLFSTGDRTLNEVDISGSLTLYNNGIQANFAPGSFTVNNKKWRLEQNGELILRDDVIFAKDLKFVQGNQEIVIDNHLNEVTGTNDLIASIKNVEIGDFTPFFLKGINLSGKLNGNITVIDPFGKPYITTESYIENFVKDTITIGRMDLTGNFDIKTFNANYTAKTDNKNYKLDIEGHYYPKDSTGTPIYNKIKIDRTNVDIIQNYLTGVFKNIDGNVDGELEIFGSPERQYIIGEVKIKDSIQLTVGFTNVTYTIPEGTILFNSDVIEFSSLKIKDQFQNTGFVKIGRIKHDFFKNMEINIDMFSDKILVLNTDRTMNSVFYGNAITDAKMKLKGEVDKELVMDVTVNNPASAVINLNTSGGSGKTLGKADFIEFKTYGKEMGNAKYRPGNTFKLNMNLNATPKAEINVILDELAGDRIRATGNGNLNVSLINGDISIAGGYTVEEGDYTFSLQSWFRKPFIIDKGSTINWNGDPLEANININAKYLAKNVAMNDLFTNISNSSSVSDLLVTANLSEKLSKPKIQFGIKYAENANQDPQIASLLELIRKDENELNKQVAFLVLFDRLLPYNNTNTGGIYTNTAINTISGLLTSQANKAINGLLREKFGNNTLQANIDFRTYSPGSLVASQSSTAAERATSTLGFNINTLNNRIVFKINGNLDFGLLSTNQSSFALLPNLAMEYKIVPDGSIVATLFFRQSIDALIVDANQNKRLSAGGGVAWRKESDNFWDLFRFKKKKRST